MLTITVSLLHGTIRVGSADEVALAGHAVAGEWPPSPARLFSALVAADGTRERCALTDGTELEWLEQQPPPIIQASALAEVLASPQHDRFVVVDGTDQGAVQNYPARRALPVRRGVRQSPLSDWVRYVWPAATPSSATLAALRARAARVGYLGCADSPVQLSASDQTAEHMPEQLNELAEMLWVPDPNSSITLPVPYPGFLAALDHLFDQWTSGVPARRAWVPTKRAGYRPPGVPANRREQPATVLWLRFDRSVAGRKVVAVTETLRDAVLDHVQRLQPEVNLPPVLHGHGATGTAWSQANFLALPDVGHRFADGRLLGAVVWLPPDTDPHLVQTVQTAVMRLCTQRLVRHAWFDVGLTTYGGERRPWTANPARWRGPSRVWVSATPVVHERWTKAGPDLAEVARWCRHAGLPAPVKMAIDRRPMQPGALDLHPSEVARPERERYPYSHLRLEFAEPITGPVVVGRGRQLGLGLMTPANNDPQATEARTAGEVGRSAGGRGGL